MGFVVQSQTASKLDYLIDLTTVVVVASWDTPAQIELAREDAEYYHGTCTRGTVHDRGRRRSGALHP